MPKKDINQLAKFFVDQTTGEATAPEETARTKASRKGGLKGGVSRSAALTKEQRSNIAKAAARARWGDPKQPEEKGAEPAPPKKIPRIEV